MPPVAVYSRWNELTRPNAVKVALPAPVCEDDSCHEQGATSGLWWRPRSRSSRLFTARELPRWRRYHHNLISKIPEPSNVDAMWQIGSSRLESEVQHWTLHTGDNATLDFGTVFALWREDEAFRLFWASALGRVASPAFCWECPAVTQATLDAPFECVFVPSPMLAGRDANPRAFSDYFRGSQRAVCFATLGGGAMLVAPCPDPAGSDFAHLARFAATASAAYSSALWQAVGEALKNRVGAAPVWLGTAGLGVPWLHIRLDSRPKYYRYAPFRAWPTTGSG